eukprot:1157388-Pelagomonas_calceolata.AAC.17
MRQCFLGSRSAAGTTTWVTQNQSGNLQARQNWRPWDTGLLRAINFGSVCDRGLAEELGNPTPYAPGPTPPGIRQAGQAQTAPRAAEALARSLAA